MRKTTIIKRLVPYLTGVQIGRLEIVTSLTANNTSKLVLVMTVSDIAREYCSTKEDEDTVRELLVKLIKVCF